MFTCLRQGKVFVPFEEIRFCLAHDGCSLLRISETSVSYTVMGKVTLKPSALLLDKADIIHITHRQCPKCGWAKGVIIAGKEVVKKM